MTRGKKPEPDAWIDLARGLESGGTLAEEHLDARTAGRMKRLARFHEFARQENANRPPESLLQKVRALAAYLPSPARSQWKMLIASLIFDSAAQPELADVRSTEAGARQLIFTAAGFDIHLRIEHSLRPAEIILVGQVLDRTRPGLPLEPLPVRLLSGEAQAAASVTNEMGEFHFEHPASPDLALEVLLSSRTSVVRVPIAALLASS
jgi:hypothetical protein